MRQDIHPAYKEVTVTCGCGNSFTTRSTKDKIAVEICSNCHPFYTGRQKFVDTAGRVERFQRKWQGDKAKKARAAAAKPVKKTVEQKVKEAYRKSQTLAEQLPGGEKKKPEAAKAEPAKAESKPEAPAQNP